MKRGRPRRAYLLPGWLMTTEPQAEETFYGRLRRSWPEIRTMLRPIRKGYSVGFWWSFTRFWFPRIAVYVATGRLYR